MEIEGERFDLRPATRDELRQVFGTWLPAARELRGCHRGVFDAFYPEVVTRLLETEAVHVGTRAGKDVVHFWACGRPEDRLHFAYVPFQLRGLGLGRAIITSVLGGYPERIWVTSTPIAKGHQNHKRFVFNPFVRPT